MLVITVARYVPNTNKTFTITCYKHVKITVTGKSSHSCVIQLMSLDKEVAYQPPINAVVPHANVPASAGSQQVALQLRARSILQEHHFGDRLVEKMYAFNIPIFRFSTGSFFRVQPRKIRR